MRSSLVESNEAAAQALRPIAAELTGGGLQAHSLSAQLRLQ